MQAPFFAITGRRGRLRSSSPWTIFKGRMEKEGLKEREEGSLSLWAGRMFAEKEE